MNIFKKLILNIGLKALKGEIQKMNLPTQGTVRTAGTWGVIGALIVLTLAPAIGVDPSGVSMPGWIKDAAYALGIIFQLLKKDAPKTDPLPPLPPLPPIAAVPATTAAPPNTPAPTA